MLLTAKSGVQPANTLTMMQVFAEVVVMVSTRRTKVHLIVTYADLVKLLELVKLFREMNAAMSAILVCSLLLMVNANPVHEELTGTFQFRLAKKAIFN